MKVWFAEVQLMSRMTSEPEEQFHRDKWIVVCIHTHDDFHNIGMARTRDVNEEHLDIWN